MNKRIQTVDVNVIELVKPHIQAEGQAAGIESMCKSDGACLGNNECREYNNCTNNYGIDKDDLLF